MEIKYKILEDVGGVEWEEKVGKRRKREMREGIPDLKAIWGIVWKPNIGEVS